MKNQIIDNIRKSMTNSAGGDQGTLVKNNFLHIKYDINDQQQY